FSMSCKVAIAREPSLDITTRARRPQSYIGVPPSNGTKKPILYKYLYLLCLRNSFRHARVQAAWHRVSGPELLTAVLWHSSFSPTYYYLMEMSGKAYPTSSS